MSEYDRNRLQTAIQYAARMADGRHPVTNKPAADHELLDNPNVIRCMHFIRDVLADVYDNGCAVGRRTRTGKSTKPDLETLFTSEVLTGFTYREDLQISYLLRQIAELLPEEQRVTIPATRITDWLREQGYLEKRLVEELDKEASVPTSKGKNLGIRAEKAGNPSNEYMRITYGEDAQLFIVKNFPRILRESAESAERKREERRRERLERSLEELRTSSGHMHTGIENPAAPDAEGRSELPEQGQPVRIEYDSRLADEGYWKLLEAIGKTQ